jgi:hypothetical protein
LNVEESFNLTTALLHGIPIDQFSPGQQWAFAEAPRNREAAQSRSKCNSIIRGLYMHHSEHV